jgi:filamentous hemagglutinin
MKPKRFYFRNTPLFGMPLRYGTPVFAGFVVLVSGLNSEGRDILRSGRGGGSSSTPATTNTAATTTPTAADEARVNAQDILRRNNQSLDAMRALQAAARAAAASNGTNNLGQNPANPTVTLPIVPNGLGTGGLQVAAGAGTSTAVWSGANLPTQTTSNGQTNVTVTQTSQQALLNWETFNVGKETTLTFDQSAGGANVSQWIAFNRVNDPTGNPTQILGSISAPGQVYLINANGVIFGGSSQVNVRSLTVSALPINTNLIAQGLLNNRDAQFLFSALSVPGGADGTPAFEPESAPAGGHFGDITVQEGAVLKSPSDSAGNGGRILLVGANVHNAGSISTEAGQTILAAGLQVGVAAHDGDDPSLRGLDVWVGDVGDYAGTATNTGLIESLLGNTTLTGRNVNQLGVVDSSTSVSLNGRIDLIASYGAVANPNFDSTTEQGFGGPLFLYQHTGVVTLGENSVSRILPNYLSTKSVPGLELPERSQMNLEGHVVHVDDGATLYAPNGDISVRAGDWTYVDADGNRTIFGADGAVEAGITNHYTGSEQKFLLGSGQIYVDQNATISTAGSVDVFVPLSQSLLTVELRGSELADSPLQRDAGLRGVPITVDIRETGTYNGRFWVGTPLADLTGLVGLIERNAAQLTAAGGNISLQAGGSIVIGQNATLDVSGGYYRHEGGLLTTSSFVAGGQLIAPEDATPDRVYDGVFNGTTSVVYNKWGVVENYTIPLYTGTTQQSYVEGATGGTLSLSAPSMALDGNLRGNTIKGEQQRSTPPAAGSLQLSFQAEKAVQVPGGSAVNYIAYSPTPAAIVFSENPEEQTTPEFSLTDDEPAALPIERQTNVLLSTGLLSESGFGSLEIVNPDGSITIPVDVSLESVPGGKLSFNAANIFVEGSIVAPGGSISFTTSNISPSFAAEFGILNGSTAVPFPTANAGRGLFVLGSNASLSTAGLLSNDLPQSEGPLNEAISPTGGTVSIRSYDATLMDGSIIDVSGGVHVSSKGKRTYGNGGSISILSGMDPAFSGVIGGTLTLESQLLGYSGAKGGSLAIQAGPIQIGGAAGNSELHLNADFFNTGGFAKYSLTGIGAASNATPVAGQFESYQPAILIAEGTSIRPTAESLIAVDDPDHPSEIQLVRIQKETALQSPVSLSFNALGVDDLFTLASLEVRGDIVLAEGASIETLPGASVSFKGDTVTLLGSVTAAGGSISVTGASAFPFTAAQRASITQALATVHVGSNAILSTKGQVVLQPDAFGRRVGTVYDGGTISLSGNILAEGGALLDVSGTSGVLDLNPDVLSDSAASLVGANSGLTSAPLGTFGIATRVDSDGGTIQLSGSQMLLSDATLLGASGGNTAVGGQLSVSSGAYYNEGDSRTGADINLIVKQSGNVIRSANIGVGIGLTDGDGNAYGNLGEFALDRFTEGSFSSLSLGGNYVNSDVPFGGNVSFKGPIQLNVSGSLRLAAGGVITANDAVNITAGYLAVGQDFRAPRNPEDVYQPFSKSPAIPNSAHQFAPTFGSGSLNLQADLIDVGTLSLQNIGNASLDAGAGDIRGNGSLHIAGDLTLQAGMVYPTTGSTFTLFAYDHDGLEGSVSIHSTAPSSQVPFSAGGHLGIFASNIDQQGVLRAPFGSITLGWDGTDLDPSDSDLDTPVDPISGTAAPIAQHVTLGSQSVTSVSALDGNGNAVVLPYGISPDGQSWIDPSGVNISLTGAPEKSVSVSGDQVVMASGAIVDIRGGGDLLASRWVPGNGGSVDLLGSAESAWGSSVEYEAGDLVSYNGQTWSARVGNSGQTPVVGSSWTKVAESFAIIPTSSLQYAPFLAFNTGANADALAGDAGYVSASLKVGDTITLDGSTGVPAGTYTLLPRRYALMEGAYLVTPLSTTGNGVVTNADGTQQVSGYLGNRFSTPDVAAETRVRFEIASSSVVRQRAQYDTFKASTFLAKLATTSGTGAVQELPQDAGYASFHGNSALTLAGVLRTEAPGLGAKVDISSFASIHLGSSASGSGVQLDTSTLTSWNAESLLIGGIRHTQSDGTTSLDVRAQDLTLSNNGSTLSAGEVILASGGNLTVADGSSLTAESDEAFEGDSLTVSGDGSLIRVSADASATFTRNEVTHTTPVLLTIGEDVHLTGGSVVVDSSSGTALASSVLFETGNLSLGAGQINLVLGAATPPVDASNPLTLSGETLQQVFQSQKLTLRSYGSIDLYGNGSLGGSSLDQLTLSASGIRGFDQSGGDVTLTAKDIVLENTADSAAPANASTSSGRLNLQAETIRLGENDVAISGYDDLQLSATSGLRFEGSGSLSTTGSLHAETPLLTGSAGASHSILASGAMVLTKSASAASTTTQALGASLNLQGASILANADILLPSGQIALTATNGNVEVGGTLSVAGTARQFNDLIRYTDAGSITLTSHTGDVVLNSGALVSVAAATGGGNAGSLAISAAQGTYQSGGTISGTAVATALSGEFSLDVGSTGSAGAGFLSGLNTELETGGFKQSRTLRIRNGDLVIDHQIHSHEFSLAADNGSILVTGGIDASGNTGGSIALAAHGDLTIASGSNLTVAATHFNSAGKGGSILLEAGTQRDGLVNANALLDLQSGATLDLSVADYIAGRYNEVGSSAFEGKFTGTLHLRAPRSASNNDLQIDSIESAIVGASSVIAEGFKVYAPANGVMNIALRNSIHADNTAFLGAAGSLGANETAMRGKLLNGAVDAGALDSILVVAPGVEIINPTGDLTLGLANPTGTTNSEGLASADWDLSSFRYGSRKAAGILTLRAGGDLVFNNTLSDGFTPIAQGNATTFSNNGNSLMWLATLAQVSDLLPTNTQSWSYRLTAGADTNASSFRSVFSMDELDASHPGKGSLLLGEFYNPVPTTTTSGSGAAIGSNGQTADTIRISTTSADRGTRFEVIRTGTGDITVSTGRDVQLRNSFATIYTAGVALPTPTTVFSTNDFVVPIVPNSEGAHPSQSAGGTTLGAIQQLYKPVWSMAGGDIALSAGGDIGRYAKVNGTVVVDSSRQMPTNWLYRRGYVDPSTGLFSNEAGFGDNPNLQNAFNITDVASSTTWWIDFSNFFQGIGTLGGGNIDLAAGHDVINVDAVAPTNARMSGRTANPLFGTDSSQPEFLNLAPDESRLLELGGGDVTVRAGNDISGGVYYVERGSGSLVAGGEVTTNAARSPSIGNLDNKPALDPLTWLPTTLFVGKSHFDVTARGDVLLGPVANPFLLPQGLNNRFWYKTYFNTFSADSGVTASSYGGDVTHRMAVTLPDAATPRSILDVWFSTQNLFNGEAGKASYYQPWLRLAETDLSISFSNVFKLAAPNLSSTSFSGDINLVGSWSLAPSSTGNLELAANDGINGLNPTGTSTVNNRPVVVWASSTLNVSDAPADTLPGVTSPLAYQSVIGRNRTAAAQSGVDILQAVNLALSETGSYTGTSGTTVVKQALHGDELLHEGDTNPVRLYAAGSDITGLTLFSPKQTQIVAQRDITDVAFYLQNLTVDDVSLVSAGRDIVLFNENSAVRNVANNPSAGNFIGDSSRATSAGTTTTALAGDLQISGPGVLEVLSGRTIDLGNGANFIDGTGVGITSIGNNRNPNLPFSGADLVILAGVGGQTDGSPAFGLSSSDLDFDAFIDQYVTSPETLKSNYLSKIGKDGEFATLSEEQQDIAALEEFYKVLRNAGREAAKTGVYDAGYAVVETLFGQAKPLGELLVRAREVRTITGGAISLAIPGGGIALASQIFGNPLTPPGVVTEYGGSISTFTDKDVNIGQARIFTLRGGDITMWSSNGNIAAGTSPRTVVTAPPTRVVADISSGDIQTDLGGLATGGGIGVLATTEGVKPGNVDLIAPKGFVDAGDAGIRVTGNLNIAAQVVLNSGNISVGGNTSGASVSVSSGPSVSTVTSASNAAAATASTTPKAEEQTQQKSLEPTEEAPSIISVEVLGYGGGDEATEEEEQEETGAATEPAPASE